MDKVTVNFVKFIS